MIYVCPLSKVDEMLVQIGAIRLISLLSEGTFMERPSAVADGNHLLINMHDIAEAQDGMTLPGGEHVRRVLDFAGEWDLQQPLLINCYAGVSRSTASAYMIAAARAPHRDEAELAQTLRKLSPTATPNPCIIALADKILGRQGRMISAIAAIGRGVDCYQGVPFGLKIDN